MKKLLALLPLLTGCGTIPTTGQRTVVGITIPFTKNPERVIVERTWLEIAAEQLAPFQWIGLACIMAGFIMAVFKIFDTKTGIAFMLLGFILSLWGIAVPKFVGVAVIIASVVFACALIYFVYIIITGRKLPKLKSRLDKIT